MPAVSSTAGSKARSFVFHGIRDPLWRHARHGRTATSSVFCEQVRSLARFTDPSSLSWARDLRYAEAILARLDRRSAEEVACLG
jgi:hypothetical protein